MGNSKCRQMSSLSVYDWLCSNINNQILKYSRINLNNEVRKKKIMKILKNIKN
jgi:hypothetical protein